MDTVTPAYSAGDLRVSDADRDRAISELSEHFQAGRLTIDEFNERSGQALQARTGNELAVLFADLPRHRAAVTSLPTPGPAPAVRIGIAALTAGTAGNGEARALMIAKTSNPGLCKRFP